MMLGLWDLERAATLLRACVRRSAVYLADDLYLNPRGGPIPRGLNPPPTLDESHELIRTLGDHVEHVHRVKPSTIRAMHQRLMTRLTANAVHVRATHPHLRGELRTYLKRQRDAVRLLTGAFRPAVWVVRRGH